MSDTMTAKQFNTALKKLDLNHTSAGRAMLTSRRQICRYAAGDAEVPGPAIVLIRLWLNLRTHHERRLIEQHTGEQTHLV